MEKILLETRHKIIEEIKTKYSEAVSDINALINLIELDNITINELKQVLQNGTLDAIADMYLNRIDSTDNLAVAGIPINKDRFKKLIHINNSDSVLTSIQQIREKYFNKNLSYYERIELSDITIINNKMVIRADFDEYLLNKHSKYADTPRQIEVTNNLIKLKEALNTYLDSISSTNSFYKNDFIQGLVPVGSKVNGTHYGNARVDIDIDFIKKL